ncbi:MAG: hypothetical protein JXQ71_10355 [Verrucomicrobia bacterium]|nr:hypothetical protein [Verrucomicrobiota bacterium]
MKTQRAVQVERSGSNAGGVLERGGPPPLSRCGRHDDHAQGTRGPAQLKLWRWVVCGCLLTVLFCVPALAQYSIDWYSMDGGGGTSTGGVYTVTGTMGQPDAGAISGGTYALQGGFWGIVAAVQTPGAPYLTVARSNHVVVVSWPLPAEGWVLQWTDALPQVSSPWSEISPPYATNGPTLQFVEPTPVGNKFYRLQKPTR